MKLIDRIITDMRIPEALSVLLNGEPRRPLFFDIETTGLQPAGCYIYLIGCLTDTPEGLRFRQWFAENADEEPALLTAFCESIEADNILVHYNGTTFDIPFLNARIRYRNLPLTMPRKEDSIDLYRYLTPCKKLFGLDNRRQPTLEKLAGYDRTDPYDGGTLISFYTEYVARCRFDHGRAAELLDSLLLHNSDDILGLSQLASLLPYCMIADLPFGRLTQSEEDGIFTITADLPYALPKPFRKVLPLPEIPEACRVDTSANIDMYAGCGTDAAAASLSSPFPEADSDGYFADLLLSDNRLRLQVPVYKMAPYFYFPNYKDYYYLPVEDKAIHKSLAAVVEKQYRKPATRETARQQKNGSFLPQITEYIGPVFRLHYGDELCFFEKRALDDTALGEYLKNWFAFLTGN